MICSNCATENPSEARFCLRCGQSLTRSCTNCGTSLPPSAHFCFSCGSAIDWSLEPASAITADEAAEGVVSDGLSFPRGTPPSTQLRQVSVLFCDLVYLTTLSQTSDPEEFREILSGYFA